MCGDIRAKLPASATRMTRTRPHLRTTYHGSMDNGDREALVLTARQLAGHAAVAVRTVQLDGLGATDTGELAIVDHSGVRAGEILGGVLDDALTAEARGQSPGVRLLELDVDGDDAIAAGLTCGG